MDWITCLNNAVEYLESNMTEAISYEQAAKIACCSTYHFQRMFSYMAGVPLSEYIRRRRMSLAAADLQVKREKVIDVALKYGYESPTAFNRAFKSIHGITPSEAAKEGCMMKAFPPISFTIMVKGDTMMEYRIEKKEAFRIVGVSVALEHDIEQNFNTVPQAWQKAAMEGTLQVLGGIMDVNIPGILGVSSCNEETDWKYYISTASKQPVPEGMEEFIVPAATWAIFHGKGTNTSMQDLERRIVVEWLPTSGYEYANAPDVEVYLNADPNNCEYEVWIPVIKK